MPTQELPRILFFPHSVRAFTSSLIGHLFEIAQEYPVVLLTEPLPEDYAALLRDRGAFPKLERVETFNCLGFTLRELVRRNRRWRRVARDMVRQVRPQLVVAENDVYSLFDMYLLRQAKNSGARCLTIQAMAQGKDSTVRRFVDLCHVYQGGVECGGIKRRYRLVKARSRRWVGHFLVHYFLPWLAGEQSLRGKSSYVLRKGASGLRDSDMNLVLTTRDLRTHLACGVSAQRLAVLPHPLHRVPHQLYFPQTSKPPPVVELGKQKSILVLLSCLAFGFRQGDYSLIPASERLQTRLRIIRLLAEIFPHWRILLKPHPDCGSLGTIRHYLREVDGLVTILSPQIPVEPYLRVCDVILDLPLSVTSVLFTASCAYPAKPIISANVDNEFYGDHYKDFPGIDYVESLAELGMLLSEIAAGRYEKKTIVGLSEPEAREFRNTNEAVRYLLQGTRPA